MVLEQLNIHFKKWTSYHIQKLTQNGAQTQNVKPKTRKLLGENLCHLELGNDFLDMTPEVKSITAESDKLDCIESENFCSSKYIREWKKKKPQTWRKYMQVTYLIKECIQDMQRTPKIQQ